MKLRTHEAYVGIGKRPHKVLTFPGPEVAEYTTKGGESGGGGVSREWVNEL